MKYNFGQKFYDVLLGDGPSGVRLYTTVLNSKQKHRLAMMPTTSDGKYRKQMTVMKNL